MSELTSSSIRWVRAPRVPAATRTDGYTVSLDSDTCWVVVGPGVGPKALDTTGRPSYLEDAIEEVDLLFPPTPWRVEGGVWYADRWQVRPNGDDTWGVHRLLDGVVEVASRQPFPSADRARRWAELRFDRGDARLRGPKPRAGSKASCKLPDVRVTDEEKAHTLAVLESLGVTYSDFVRMSLRWVEEQVIEAGAWEVQRVEGGGATLVPTDAV
jgi:hypothetical protein